MQDLLLLVQTCSTAIDAPDDNDDDDALDIDPLLAHIDHLSTKLVLVLKPPAPAHAASVPILRDLTKHTSALAHTARLFHDDTHGATLTKLIRTRVSEIIDALGALARSFLDSPQDYLLRIGTLHDLITSARCPSGLPKDNQAAVCLAWKSDCDALQDNLEEIARIIAQAESQDDTPDDFDDGWDEFGFADATNLDKDELARTQNVHQLLRLTTLLHKRIFLDLLSHPSSAPLSAFDNILQQSNLLLSTSDDLVAALYTPQDPDQVRDHILLLASITTCLQTQTTVFLPPADQLTNELLKDGSPVPPSPAKKRADKKWFDTCVDQIRRLSSSLTGSSSQSENPTSARSTA